MDDNTNHQYPDFIETTGYGTGEGLCGWNCRHGFQPWDERLRYQEPKIDEKESKRLYDISQKQRAKERAIRKTKRQMLVKQEEINAASGEEKERLQTEYDRLAEKLTKQNADYNSFCKDNDLATQYDRLRLADYNRKSEKDAAEAFKKNSLQAAEEDSKIDPVKETLEKQYRYATPEEYSAMCKKQTQKVSKDDVKQIAKHTKSDGTSGGYAATRNYQTICRALRDEEYDMLDVDDKATVDALRRAISGNALEQDYTLTRYVNADYLGEVFDVMDAGSKIDTNGRLRMTKVLENTNKQMKNWIGKTFTEKSFVSTSVLKDKNIMSDKPVRLTINAESGTGCYLPKNKKESECILGENTRFYITDVKVALDSKLEIFATLIK